jgi:putative ABC transport system permease protein
MPAGDNFPSPDNCVNILLSIWAIFVIAVKRIISQKGLAFASLIGLVFSIALTTSIPVYTDAVYFRLFNENLDPSKSASSTINKKAPFALLFSYQVDPRHLKRWEDVQPVSQFITQQAAVRIRLPLKQVVRYFNSDTMALYPKGETNFNNTKTLLGWYSFSTLNDIESKITILEGRLPAVNRSAGSTVEVLISKNMADKLGLQAGEEYTTFARLAMPDTGATVAVTIPIRIAGIWKPTDPTDLYWFIQTSFLDERMLVTEEIFSQQIASYIAGPIYTSMWYVLLDGSNVQYTDAGPISGRITAVYQQAVELLPDTKLLQSPLDALAAYHSNSVLLTVQLYAFSLPILGLLLTFVSMTAGLSVEQRRNEIAVMRSRGAVMMQMIGIATLEGLILGAIGLGLSIPISLIIAREIGQVRTFLDFGGLNSLQVRLTTTSLEYGLVAVALALLSQILPTISAARHTVTTYKQERSRMLRSPWWQRAWLDVLLFIPTGYGAYLLRQQGSVAMMTNRNPFDNPLLFLIPALCVFSLSLFFMRLMPMLVSAVAWLSSKTRSVGLLMASRQLSRTPSFYVTPLMLLILTLSLSAYTASLAVTVDRHLYDQTFYSVGGDLKFLDFGESQKFASPFGGGGSTTSDSSAGGSSDFATSTASTEPTWVFLPVQEYLKIPGITKAARVGRYPASASLGGREQDGTFLGVDRYDFPLVSYWRRDFSSTNLGDLMNFLGMYSDGVLIPQNYVGQAGMKIGDTLPITVKVYGEQIKLDFKIVGGFKYFPTWYPSTGPLIVGNLDYLFDGAGGMFPYQVWLKTRPGLDLNKLEEHSASTDGTVRLTGVYVDSSLTNIETEQARPQRQGLFGVLSVGFFAAGSLTVLGFLLYALFSFRRRFIELGVLRAIGLSYGQMVSYLAWELAFLILMGTGAGTFLGVGAASWFIPYLQLGYGEAAYIPPYIIQISWPAILQVYSLFGIVFVFGLVGLVIMLQRMKISQAIKLGETV